MDEEVLEDLRKELETCGENSRLAVCKRMNAEDEEKRTRAVESAMRDFVKAVEALEREGSVKVFVRFKKQGLAALFD